MHCNRIQNKNIINYFYLLLLWCFQADKIDVSKLSSGIFFSNYYLNKSCKQIKFWIVLFNEVKSILLNFFVIFLDEDIYSFKINNNE